MAWLEEEPIDKILDRLLNIWWIYGDVHDEAELSRPMQEKVSFVSLQQGSSSSAILNGLSAFPDIADKVFEYLVPGDLLQLHRAVWPLRRLHKLGRLLPGLRELRHLGAESWLEKVRLLPPSRQRANNTDKPSRDAIKFMSVGDSWQLRRFMLYENAANIETWTYVKLKDSVMKRWLVERLGQQTEARWRIARLGDRVFQQIQLLERIRRRHEVDDKDEREKLMAEGRAMSDAIGERIDAIRNGDDISTCPVCFSYRCSAPEPSSHNEYCGRWIRWLPRRDNLSAGRKGDSG